MDERIELSLYLDQNILQYAFEEKVQITDNPTIHWVYSDEHFNEIKRKEDPRFFEVLRRLKARKLETKLDSNNQIIDEATLLPYTDPAVLYKQYLENVESHKFAEGLFNPMQNLFFGNKEALNPEAYGNAFKGVLDKLLEDVLEGINDPELSAQVKQENDSVIDELTATLKTVQDQTQPLNKTRKLMSSKQFSDLKEEDGCIIDQIWQHVKEKAAPLSKDQMFGKEKLLHERKDESDKYNSLYQSVIKCHVALNICGYWPDEGLPKPNKIDGINSDALHIANTIFCSGLVSSDDRMCKKARAVFSYLELPRIVYQVLI